MEPEDTSLEQPYSGSQYDSSLEGGARTDFSYTRAGADAPTRVRRSLPTINLSTVLFTGGGLLVVLVVLALAVVFTGFGKSQSPKQSSVASNFAVTKLAVKDVNGSEQLKLGEASHLAVNGQLQVNNTAVLKPTERPSTPTLGQIYFDKATNQPYYFNGTTFVSLAPVAVPQHISSLGGAAGAITLGSGLQISGNQLSIATSYLQAFTSNASSNVSTPRVTSLQGLTGNVTLVAGSGISISGTTISNTGITNLTTTSSGITIVDQGNGTWSIDVTGLSGTPLLLGPNTPQIDASNNPTISFDKTGSGNLISLANNGITSFVVSPSGQITTGSISYSQVQGAPATTVTDIAGVSGGLTLGAGLSIVGNQLSNSGVVSVAGTTDQVIVSGSGALTLSLPQSIATTSAPIFGGLTLNGGLTVNSSATIAGAGGLTVQGGNLTLGTSGTSDGLLRLNNAVSNRAVVLQGLNPSGSGDVTIQIPSIAGGTTDQVCLLGLANCAGAGAGVTASGTSAGYIPYLSAAQVITNSVLFQSGSSIGINTTNPGAYVLNVQGGSALFGNNLTVDGAFNVSSGNSTFGGNVNVSGAAAFTVGTGAATFGGTLTVADLATLQNGLAVTGATDVDGALTLLAGNDLTVAGGNTTLNGGLTASGATQLQSTLAVTGLATLNGGVTVNGTTTANGNITQSGTGSFTTGTGAVTLNGNTTVTGTGSFTTGTGAVTLNGNTTVTGTNDLTVSGGDTNLGGDLQVNGTSTFVGAATVQGAGGLTLGVSGSVDGTLRFANTSNAQVVNLQSLAPTGAGDVTIQIPSIAGGTTDQVCLLTLANCAGAGGAVTSTTGAANYVARFTSASVLGIGALYDTGTAVGINTTNPGAYVLNVQGGNVNFSGSATVGAGLNVSGATNLAGNVSVTGSSTLTVGTGATTLGGTLAVTGATTLSGTLAVSGTSNFNAAVAITGSSTLSVGGATTLSSLLTVAGAATFNDDVTQSGTGSFTTGTGAVTLNGDVSIASGRNFVQNGTGTFDTGTGAVGLNGATTITGSNSFTVGTGSTTLGGTLNVTGVTTLGGGATITGSTLINTTGSGSTTIGTVNGAFSVSSNGVNITTGGAISGVSTLTASGAITAATSGNTINGVVINSGALSAVTGITSNGGYTQSGSTSNTFSGGTTFSASGTALTVNNNATISGTATIGTLSVGSGGISSAGTLTVSSTSASTIAGQLNLTATGTALNVTNSGSFGGDLAVQGSNGVTVGVAGSVTGVVNFANSSNSNLASLQAAAPSGSGTAQYVLPSLVGGTSDTVCLLNLNNCGAAPNVVTASSNGTTNKLAKFTGATSIADSSISDDGSTVTVSAALSATSVSTTLVQSAGNLSITPSGTLTMGVTSQQFTLQGSASSTITASAGGFTSTVGFATPTANRTITVPNESGVICLQNSNNCGFALASSGVTLLNGVAGNLTIANASASGSTITLDDASTTQKGIAQFNSSNFSASGGVIDTIQGISTTSSVQFGSLTLGTGDVSLSATGAVNTNFIKNVGSNDITFDAAANAIIFKTSNGTNSFVFPTYGGLGQVICTSGVTCASGGGQALILEPSSIQTASANRTAIYVNKAAGTGNILQLQAGGSDALVISNSGDTTINGSTTIASLTVPGTITTSSIVPTSALTVGSTSQSFTLQGTGSSLISATGGGYTTNVGFAIGSGGSAPNGNITYQFQNDNTISAGTYTICTTAGNCAGVGGTVTTSGGTAGKIAKFTSSGNIADSLIAESGSTVSIGGNLQVGVSGSSQLTLGVGATAAGTLVFNNASNSNTTTVELAGAPSSSTSIKLPNQSGTIAVAATGPIQLDALTGQISCPTCLTGGGGGGAGVSSLNSLSGSLTIANASTAGSTITLDNASTTVKGIAQFNATNFTASSGTINTVQDIATSSSVTFANLALQGSSGLTIGSNSNVGQLAFRDGTNDGYLAAFSPVTLTGNRTITIPNASGTLAVSASGNLSLSATGDVSITDSPNFATSVTTPSILSSGSLSITSSGQLTVGSTGQQLRLLGNGSTLLSATVGANTTTVNFTSPTANRTIAFPDASGTVCLQNSTTCGFALTSASVASVNGLTGALTVANASGIGSTITINDASTTQKGIAQFNSSNFTASSGIINTIQDITTSSSPTFSGLTVNAGGATVNGAVTLNGNTIISGTNTLTVGTGAASFGGTVGISGLTTMSGGVTVTGTAAINTTGTANTAIGNATGSFSVTSSGINISVAGAVSGATTISASGAISAATSGNTINGVIINAGAVSGVTGYTQTSGNFSQSGAGTFGTGTGAVSLNGNTSITGSRTLSVGTGATSLGGILTVTGATTLNSTLAVGSSSQFQVSAAGDVTSGTINGQTIGASSVFTGSLAVQGSAGVTVGVAGVTDGVVTLANSTSSRTVSLQGLNPSGTGNATIQIPSIAGGSTDQVCLATLGNCVGVNGAASTTGGSQYYLARYNTASQITISQLYDNGNFVGINTTANNGQLSVVAAGTQTGLFVQGAGSGTSPVAAIKSGGSTGDLLQLQNSSGVALMKVDSTGNTYVAALDRTTAGALNIGTTNATSIGLAKNTTVTGSFAAGSSSQFQVSTAGAVTAVGVNSGTGLIQGTGGLTASGTITLSSLNTAGIVHTNASGVLSTGAVVLGSETTGNYVATLGTLTGLSTTGNTGAGSTPTLSVLYGSTANTAAQGNTALSFTGSGNLTGTVSGTAGGGITTNTLAIVNSPTFSGTLAVQGASVSVGTAGSVAGSVILANASNAHSTVLQAASSATQDQTITIPASSAVTDQVCLLTLGNCVGVNGAASTTGGSQYYLARYNTASQITISQLYDNGNFVGINTTANNGQLSVVAAGTQTGLFVQGAGSGTSPVAAIKSGGSTGDLLQLQNSSGVALVKVDASGNLTGVGATLSGPVLFKNTTNSTTTFQVQNAGAATILNVDTTNSVVSVTGQTAIASGISQAAAAISTTSEAGRYGFEEGSGTTATDGSAAGNNATTVSGQSPSAAYPTYTTDSRIGTYALKFNGTTNGLSVPDGSSLDFTNTLTFETWVKFDAQNSVPGYNWNMILSKRQSLSSDFGYYWGRSDPYSTKKRMAFGFSTNGTSATNTYTSNSSIEDSRWYHLAVTYDGSNVRFYVDGKLDSMVAATGTIWNSGQPLSVGFTHDALVSRMDSALPGTLDDLRIFGRALSSSEIFDDYTRGVANKSLTVASGNVGIGTTTPTSALDIQGNSIAATLQSNAVTTNGGLQNSPSLILRSTYDADSSAGVASAQTDITLQNIVLTGGSSPTSRLAVTAGSGGEVLSVMSSGNIGIGTTSPQQRLTLANGSSFATELSVTGSPNPTATTGGTLGAGTYYYVISASDGTGFTAPSREFSCTVDGTTTNACSVNFTHVSGATSYRVYRGTTAGGENVYYTVTPTSNSVTFLDTGAAGTAGSPPTVTGAYTVRLNGAGTSQLLGGNVGIGTATPGSLLTVAGTQPFAATSGNGSAATTVLTVTGAKGGGASATTGVTAGAGAGITLTAGSGGDATGASGANTGGSGGNVLLQAGAGGSATSGTAGAAGSVIVRNLSNSTSAFQVQNASSVSVLTVDTTNAAVAVGGTLSVSSTSSFTGLLTANGGITIATAKNFINGGSTLLTAIAVANHATGGDIGTAAATVDVATTFNVTQTTASQTLTLPAPTTTTAGRIVYINSLSGNVNFTMYGVTIAANTTAAFMWNGTAWVATSTGGTAVNTVGTIDSQTKSANGAVISGSTIYLQSADASNVGLVTTGVQTLAGAKTFSGAATFSASGTALTVNNDAAVNGTLTTGTLSVTNAATIGTGLTVTSGGATITAGDVAITAGNLTTGGTQRLSNAGALSNITGYAQSSGNFLQSGAGTFGTGTGAVSLNGSTSVTGSNTFTVGTGLTTLGGGLTASGTITLSSLNTAGIVHTNASGVLSTGAVVLGSETTGNYVATLGTLTGLSTTGNTGAGSTPTLSVLYGSTANTAVQGNTTLTVTAGTGLTGGSTITLGTGGTSTLNVAYGSTAGTAAQGNTSLSFTGSGNLTGALSGTAGGGFTTTTLSVVNNPTFSGLITGQANTTGLALTGTPTNSATASLFQLGSAIAGGNTATNGGTYLGINAPASGAGSAADFLNFQVGGSSRVKIDSTGLITAVGLNAGTGLIQGTGGLTVTGTTTLSSLTTGVVLSNGTGQLSSGTVNLASSSYVSGTLPVANGGTGATTLAANGILYGNGTSAIQATTAAANSILITNGSNVPSLSQTLPSAVQGNITTLGTVTAGSLSTGFGTINTGNTITGTTINATSALQLNGTNINTAGTLSNVAYLNQTNTFSAANTFSSTVAVQGSAGLTIGVAATTQGKLNLATTGAGNAIIQSNAQTADRTISLPTISANDTICLLTANNCAVANNVTGSGTANYVARFSGTNTIATGLLQDTTTAVYVSGSAGSGGGLFNVGTTNQFQVSSAGAVTAVGVNSGTGLIQGTGGATVTGVLNLNATGTAATNIGTGSSGDVNIANSSSTGAVGIGNAATSSLALQSAAITIGNFTGSSNSSIQIGNGNIPATYTQTISIGTNPGGAGATNVTLGSVADGSATTIKGGTGNITINPSGTSNTGVVVKPTNNSTAAFQIQNAASTTLFNADTSTMTVTVGAGGSGELMPWATNTNALPSARYYATSVAANGYVYVMGGGSSAAYYAKLNADGSTSTWTTSSNPLPASLTGATSVAANGYVYVMGGHNGSSVVSTVYYAKLNADGSTSTWTTSSNPLPAARQSTSSVVVNGYVYVIGGDNAGSQSTVYYAKLNADGSTGAWTTNANALPSPRSSAVSITANGYIYVIGGGNTVYYAKLNADGSTGTWTTSSNPLPAVRNAATAAYTNGYLYVIGGDNAGAQSTTYYAKLNADGSTSTWTTNANALPAARFGATTIAANGYIYVMGGYDGVTIQSTVYYASTQRLRVNAALDLIGATNGNLADGQLGLGGELTAGNTNIIGALQVQGNASFTQSVSILGTLAVGDKVAFKNTTNSTTAFQVQNASGTALVNADTTNMVLTLGSSSYGELKGWTANANAVPAVRVYAGSVTANGYVYTIGGSSNGANAQSTVYYAKLNADGSTSTWTTNANALPAGRKFINPIVANGYVYVIGGANTTSSSQSTVYYAKLNADGSTGAWTTSSNPLPAARSRAVVASANGYVYVMAGEDGSSDQSTVYYAKLNADGSTGTWSTNANALPAPSTNATSVVANGYVYVMGGDTSATPQSTVYYAKLNADGSTGTWTTSSNPLPAARSGAVSTVSNGYIYAIGGVDDSANVQSTVYYAKLNADGSTGTWTTNASSLLSQREFAAVATANGYVYVIGGDDGATVQSTVYYASTQRLRVNASLDLVGGTTGNLADGQSGLGGELTAGNTNIIGALQVQGNANFAQSLNVAGQLSVSDKASFKNTINSTTAFQIQNASNQSLFVADTTNQRIAIGPAASAANGVLTIGTNTTAASGGLYFGTDANLYRSAATTLKTDSKLVVAGSGNGSTYGALFKNTTNSTTAFAVQNAAGGNLFSVNTTTRKLVVGDTGYADLDLSWATAGTTLPASVAYHASVTTRNIIYVLGGHNGTTAVNTIYYTAATGGGATGSWTTNATTLPTALYGLNAITANGYIYVYGGKNAAGVTQSATYYARINSDGSVGSWTTTTALPAARSFAGGFVDAYRNRIYLAGGFDASEAESGDVYYATLNLDGSVGAWTTQSSAIAALGGIQAVTNGSTVYIAGGLVNSFNLYTCAISATGLTGCASGGLTENTSTPALGILNGKLYIAARNDGFMAGNPLNTVLSIAGNANATPLPAYITGASAVTINGTMYVIGGDDNGDGSSAVNTVYYTTNATQLSVTSSANFTSGLVTDNLTTAGLEVNSAALFNNNLAVAGTLSVGDKALFKNATNSTTAFQIQNANGATLVSADTTNMAVTLGSSSYGELGAWSTNTNALPAARHSATSVTVNGYVYVMGGNGSGGVAGYQSTVYYAKLNADGSTGTWTTNAATVTPSADATSVAANGYVYYIGGDNTSGTPTAAVYYAKLNADGSTGSFTSTTSLPANRSNATSVVANGYVYVMGGGTAVYYAKLNPNGTVGSWSTNANALPTSASSATSVVANGYVYVMGGSSTSTVYYAKLNADGSTGTWTTSSNPLPATRNGATSAIMNGYVYVMGGFDGSSYQSTVYYAKLNADGSTGAWTTGANALPATRSAATSVSVNGYVYVIGGDSGTYQSTVYYASTQRLRVNASLDLVGGTNGNLADGQSGLGGELTAGNTNIIGALQVQGNANFAQSVGIAGELSVAGSVAFRNTTNSTTAFQVQNAAGTSLVVADTTNSRLYVGSVTADSTGALLVLDTKNTSGDPTGVDGAMYYNSSSKSFRCYSNGAWRSCVAGVVAANVNTTGNTVANTATETAFATNYSIPANDCQPGRVYKITAQGVYGSTGTPTLNLLVKLGSTTVGQTTAQAVGTTQTNRSWRLEYSIICQTTGASGTVEGQGIVNRFTTNDQTANQLAMSNTAAVTVDTTTSQTLQVSATWSAANALNTITARQIIIETSGP